MKKITFLLFTFLLTVSWQGNSQVGSCEMPDGENVHSLIKRVQFLNIQDQHTSKKKYSDFSFSEEPQIFDNQNVQLTLEFSNHNSGTSPRSAAVWINSGVNGEFVKIGSKNVEGSNNNVQFNIRIPSGTAESSYRLRVQYGIGKNRDNLVACAPDYLSETRDYKIFYKGSRSITTYEYRNDGWHPAIPVGDTKLKDIVINNYSTTTEHALSGVINVRNITFSNNKTLGIKGVLNLFGNINGEGKLEFLSDQSATGEVGYVSPKSDLKNRKVTIHNYMSAIRAYRMVSSGVTTTNSIRDNWQEGVNNTSTTNNQNPHEGFGTHITGSQTGANGFDATTTGNPSMFTVNISEQQFESVPSTLGILEAGKPYLMMVRGSRAIDLSNNLSAGSTVLRATGKLAIGDHSQNFPAANNEQFVMFGNPYQSAVDVRKVFSRSTGINKGYYYIYDPNVGADGLGGYVTIDLSDGTNTLPVGMSGTSAANQYLQPGQGAQVQVSGPAEIKFSEGDKAPGAEQFTPTSANRNPVRNELSVQLYTTENYNTNGRIHDSFIIRFADGYDNGLTNMDAIKPFNFAENLGIELEGKYLSIEKRNMPQAGEVYQLFSTGYNHLQYTLSLNISGLENTALYLEDRFTGTSTLLNPGETVYNFMIDQNDALSLATDRFLIRTEARLSVEENGIMTGVSLYPNPLNGNIFYINAPNFNGERLEITIADMAGRQIYKNDLDCVGSRIAVDLRKELNTGVYLVTLRLSGNESTYRLVKE